MRRCRRAPPALRERGAGGGAITGDETAEVSALHRRTLGEPDNGPQAVIHRLAGRFVPLASDAELKRSWAHQEPVGPGGMRP
jgi:hypothetical protein